MPEATVSQGRRSAKGRSLRPLISRAQVRRRVKELATEIRHDYQGRRPVLIGVLKGAFVFLADLIRELAIPLEVDFVAVSSYGHGRVSKGEVTIRSGPSLDIAGREVLLIEDIVDSGFTLNYLRDYLTSRQAASVRCCALLARQSALATGAHIEYLGFPIPEGFVVGYGLDFAEQYRQLNGIYVLEER